MLIALALIFYKFMFHMTILQPAHLSAGKGGIKGPAPLLRRGLGLIRLPHLQLPQWQLHAMLHKGIAP